jgi:hypothetical protein
MHCFSSPTAVKSNRIFSLSKSLLVRHTPKSDTPPSRILTMMYYKLSIFGPLFVALIPAILAQADYIMDDSNSTISYAGPWTRDTFAFRKTELAEETLMVLLLMLPCIEPVWYTLSMSHHPSHSYCRQRL